MGVTVDQFRQMAPADVYEVLELERAIFPTPWTEGMLRDELAAPGRAYLIAEEVGRIVAYGGVMIVAGDAHIMTIAVEQEHRRTGLATRMLLALIDAATDGGAAHLTLELRLSNREARGLYEKFGFQPVGVRRGYYGDEDALVMWALDVTEDDYRHRLDRIRAEVAQ